MKNDLISFISFWTCPLSPPGVLSAGGLNIYLYEMSQSLAKLGWRIDIYTRKHQECSEEIVELNNRIRVIHLNLFRSERDPQIPLYEQVPEFSAQIINHQKANKKKYALLHSHYYFSGLAGLLLKDRLNIPLFHTFHTLGVMKKIYGGQIDKKRIEAEKKIIDGVDKLVASTDFEKEELRNYYQADTRKIEVISPGVDTIKFHPVDKIEARKILNLPTKKQLILFVGRIDPIKGITTLIEAIYQLTNLYKQFKNNYQVLLIGGDLDSEEFRKNEEVIRIRKMLMDRDLECYVKFLGAKPHRELSNYYSASDVVVLPSLYESFGLVILEAMAVGAAVLASRVGGLKYLITDGENGHLFENQNTMELARKLWDLLNDDTCRTKLGQSAHNFAQKLSWDNQAKQLSALYQKVIKEKRV